MRNKFRDMQDTIEARNDEIASLNSALIRIKNSVMSENSSAAKVSRDFLFCLLFP
jgi:chromosome condensin MukBEF complex kleisin-like MukF subunit